AALIFSQPSRARARPCSASSRPTPGKAAFEKSNHGIPKTFVPFGVNFISLSLTQHSLSQAKAFLATLACVTRVSRSVFDQILDEP
ncbi:hypothetical protein, partial [Bradyrhizobium sp. Rc2d]|uniref:hypothetical protein n=1 Tax=Bradyrhizobium sp. Rc2d TaxID=1855321 RepID=UPI001AEC9FD1